EELDSRVRGLPPCFGLQHFKGGWSHLSQISGKERKDMACILLGCLVGKVPSEIITCYRALLDFIYLAQYSTHDNDTLQYLENSLNLFHEHKNVLVELGIREHLDIPKFHSMLHYAEAIRNFGTTDNYNTEMFEHFHIDMAKEGWRASNIKNEVPQMTSWLTRQEKVSLFQSYIQNATTDDDRNAIPPSSIPALPGVGLAISQRPAVRNQSISSIQNTHHAPSFSLHLREYLNSILPRGDSIPRSQLANAQLPFNRLDVWHTCKCVTSIHLWSYSAFLGMRVGRLRLIFKLPERVSPLLRTIPSWPTYPLAYIEWYCMSHHPGSHHNMYTIT
ncbi:hypothetical protein SCLCIDRAFT_95955, partial [Scleroderma citrinum Foug A]